MGKGYLSMTKTPGFLQRGNALLIYPAKTRVRFTKQQIRLVCMFIRHPYDFHIFLTGAKSRQPLPMLARFFHLKYVRLSSAFLCHQPPFIYENLAYNKPHT